MDAALRALNRFGLGAGVGEGRRLSDPRGWLRAQLHGDAPRLTPPAGADPDTIGDAVRGLRQLGQGDEAARRQARRHLQEIAAVEVRQALTTRVTSDRPFVERLVAFWSNHLCVSMGAKVLVAPLAGSYERDVIRPHVLGRFEDMVLASARHPAMLAYLDNFQSIGPASPAATLGGRAGRPRAAQQPAPARRGLNENYARELLELHTLGVDGGYTQQDVQELARMLTGWTIDGIAGPGARAAAATQRGRGARRGGAARAQAAEPDGPLRFVFREALHEPGAKTLLGTRYGEDGEEEAVRAIKTLVRPPLDGALRCPQAGDALRQRRAARGGRGPGGADVPLERRQPEGGCRRVDRPARGVAGRPAQVPRPAGLAGGGATRARPRRGPGERRPAAAAIAPAAVVARRAQGLRRHDAGMGRP